MIKENWINLDEFNPKDGEYWVQLAIYKNMSYPGCIIIGEIDYEILHFFKNENGLIEKKIIQRAYWSMASNNEYMPFPPCQYLKLDKSNIDKYVHHDDIKKYNLFNMYIPKFDWSFC